MFLSFAVLGGVVEFAASWFLQRFFGILAWDYTGTFLSIDGRTNGFFMFLWGVLGVLFVRVVMPWVHTHVFPLVERVPRRATGVCAALMVVDIVLTLIAFNCWYHRSAGQVPQTPVQTFCAEYFDDGFMARRFEVMSLYPDDAHRAR